MTAEQDIETSLAASFPDLAGKIRIQRVRRMYVDVPAQQFREVFEHLIRQRGFCILCTITGLDLGGTLGVLYHLAQEGGIVLTLGTAVPKDAPVIRTVTDLFPAADAYEREMVDLLGMQVEGLPSGNRYPLPDGWPANEYPLRKDWKATEETPLPGVPKEASNA